MSRLGERTSTVFIERIERRFELPLEEPYAEPGIPDGPATVEPVREPVPATSEPVSRLAKDYEPDYGSIT